MKTIAAQLTGLLLLACAVATFGCGGAHVKPGPGPRGTVRFDVIPQDAGLEVDEQRLGPAKMFREHGVLLRPGQHRVIVRRSGFFPEYRLIQVTEGEVVLVKVRLRPIPP